jgi:ABC-type polysaccharide/polyol phosphate transport system ATPase subunit
MKRIIAKNISKTFHSGFRDMGILGMFFSVFSGTYQKKSLKVLDSVSFECSPGEIVGLIGRNGCGKSTLLRLIAGIYQNDSGILETNGAVTYLNGFNIGLNPRLTMRENIFLVGAIMDIPRREVIKKIPAIVEFSGLSEFLDTKIYQFSSGMTARLGFSAVTNFMAERHPSIILLDEVFEGGGDVEFQRKAIETMEEFLKGDATVILVSHQTKAIEKYCPRTILLERGKMVADGDTKEVMKKYEELLNNREN